MKDYYNYLTVLKFINALFLSLFCFLVICDQIVSSCSANIITTMPLSDHVYVTDVRCNCKLRFHPATTVFRNQSENSI